MQSLLLGGAIAACPCCVGDAQASGNAKFDYGTLSGPISWGGTCSSGLRQSPINIPAKAIRTSTTTRAAAACRPAQVDVRGYKPVKPMILNTGVGTMQVRARATPTRGPQVARCSRARAHQWGIKLCNVRRPASAFKSPCAPSMLAHGFATYSGSLSAHFWMLCGSTAAHRCNTN
jgi:hypothetical protein